MVALGTKLNAERPHPQDSVINIHTSESERNDVVANRLNQLQHRDNLLHKIHCKPTVLFCFFSVRIGLLETLQVIGVESRFHPRVRVYYRCPPAFNTSDRRLVAVLLEGVLRTNVAVVRVEESEMLLPVCC